MAKGELITACEAAQNMLFLMQVLEDIGLCMKMPMVLHVDCKGTLDLTYGWNISGLMQHISVQVCFLCELKEANLVLCIWLSTDTNMVDMYTKTCHHIYTVVVNVLWCMMTMMMMTYATKISTSSWTLTSQITNSQGEGVGPGHG